MDLGLMSRSAFSAAIKPRPYTRDSRQVQTPPVTVKKPAYQGSHPIVLLLNYFDNFSANNLEVKILYSYVCASLIKKSHAQAMK
jgi:hypothetical protein